MYTSIKEFETDFAQESGNTQKLMNELTDASLKQAVDKDHRTLGRMAWHIITTYPEMMGATDLKITGVKHDDPVPKTAAEIKKAYESVTKSLREQIAATWNDSTLKVVDKMYGAYEWPRALTLQILIRHEVHHRAQMTVLMRQAGLKVPGVYGPSHDEWGAYGQKPPEV
ncbi:hypothetical protein C3F09_09205 [candidate division GN15 bacterium]|uniref:Damage-inducible protein DinB n=1 Tax=candidate division GN15 bacterium TaxID=2072418 RepID=A0A855X4Z6_9BACT|nr:MAG: hypothetical protein C3F09_09205 [candidate division GN15 bacterium]